MRKSINPGYNIRGAGGAGGGQGGREGQRGRPGPTQQKEPGVTGQGAGEEKGRGRPVEKRGRQEEENSKNSTVSYRLSSVPSADPIINTKTLLTSQPSESGKANPSLL